MIAADFREKARNSLNGKWKTAIIVSLIYSLVVCVLSSIGAYDGNNILFKIIGIMVSIATIVISPALMYGVTSAYMKLNKGEEVKAFDFWKLGFDNFGRSWKIVGNILKKCIWYVLGLVILYILFGIAVVSISAAGLMTISGSAEIATVGLAGLAGASVGTIILGIVIMIVAIFAGIKSLYYVLATYLAIDNPTMEAKDAVQKSEDLMKENRWRYFCLMFSFIGWAILAGLVGWLCGMIVGWLHINLLTSIAVEVGVIVLTPYIVFATIAFYEDRIGKSTSKENGAIDAESKTEE